MPMFRSLAEIDSSTLARYRAHPASFIEECLISPYDLQPYRLNDAERQFIHYAFQLDSNGRLLFPLWVYGAIKKSRKTELAALITVTMILLFGGKFAEGYVVANDKSQAIDRCFAGCRRIIEASPMLRVEVKCTQDKITFVATESSIVAIPNDAAGLAGGHPTISVHDEAWAAPPGERGRAVYDQLVPVPSRKISCRLVVSHAGVADEDRSISFTSVASNYPKSARVCALATACFVFGATNRFAIGKPSSGCTICGASCRRTSTPT
jgi:hypothetical protein